MYLTDYTLGFFMCITIIAFLTTVIVATNTDESSEAVTYTISIFNKKCTAYNDSMIDGPVEVDCESLGGIFEEFAR